jgi:hypothetical protein
MRNTTHVDKFFQGVTGVKRCAINQSISSWVNPAAKRAGVLKGGFKRGAAWR